MSTILSVLIGGAITWLVAWVYYRDASKQLIAETSKLRKALNLMIRGMEEEGWVTGVKRDDKGAIVSWTQTVRVPSVENPENFGRPEIIAKDNSA
jgi:hypothetical protein